jgi:regulation of enolase protein 1 (concanavalin A-like superfamily)
MKIMSNTTAKRNQRVTARLRRIQGQVAAIERFLVEDPHGNPPLPTAASVGIGVSISSPEKSRFG